MLYERPHLSPRPPQKISLRHDHDWTRGNDQLGSTVEQQPVGKLVQQSFGEEQHETFSQPKPKPICDRSVKPDDTERVFVEKGKTSRSQEIDDKRLQKELGSSDRTGKPERLSQDIRVKHAHDGTGQPVEQKFEEYALRLNASVFASRSKAKGKPQRREPAGSFPRTIPIGERIWTDVAPGEYSISDYMKCRRN